MRIVPLREAEDAAGAGAANGTANGTAGAPAGDADLLAAEAFRAAPPAEESAEGAEAETQGDLFEGMFDFSKEDDEEGATATAAPLSPAAPALDKDTLAALVRAEVAALLRQSSAPPSPAVPPEDANEDEADPVRLYRKNVAPALEKVSAEVAALRQEVEARDARDKSARESAREAEVERANLLFVQNRVIAAATKYAAGLPAETQTRIQKAVIREAQSGYRSAVLDGRQWSQQDVDRNVREMFRERVEPMREAIAASDARRAAKREEAKAHVTSTRASNASAEPASVSAQLIKQFGKRSGYTRQQMREAARALGVEI